MYKWQAIKFRGLKKVSKKGAFYFINHHNSDSFFRLHILTVWHFYAIWGRKELFTSKEIPIIHCLKKVLKLKEFLLWKTLDEFEWKWCFFSFKRAWQPSWFCTTQFLSWGLSIEVSFISKFYCKKHENWEKGKIHYMTKLKQFSQTVWKIHWDI